MAEEAQAQEQVADEPQGEQKPKTDWKAEARKWEALAKKGKAAEDELAALKEAQMSEQEKANARAERAEAELLALKAEQARLQSAREIAADEGVPSELLEFCADADAMAKFCKVYKSMQQPVHSAAPSIASRVVREGGAASNREKFAEFAAAQLNRR